MEADQDESAIISSEQALRRVIHDSNEILVKATTVHTVHKSTLTLTRLKVVGEKRAGFGNVAVMSARIEDVLNINGSTGPFWGYIKLATKFAKPGEPYTMGPFQRQDVLQLKRIIQGYILALQKHINVDSVPTAELRDMLYDLGEDDRTIQ